MAEALLSTLIPFVVTELIKTVITLAQTAKRCKSECRKLEEELKLIQPDVEKIEQRLAELRDGHLDEGLSVVENWLEKLKEAISKAEIEVQKCNSSRFKKCDLSLSTRITALYKTITKAAANRAVLFMQLKNYSPPWYNSPGEAVLRRLSRERAEALRREDQTRISMNSPSLPYLSQDPDSPSVHSSSSSGYDSSGSLHLRLMSQQRNEALQREDRTRSSSMGQNYYSHQPEVELPRYTLDASSYAPPHQQRHDSNRMSYPWYAS